MANNLRKFNTYSDYEAAVLVKPAVSLIAATDEVIFDQKDAPVPPTPTFSGLTVHYNITDISQPTQLFISGGGSGGGSGSGGGVLPSAMIIDGTAVEVTNTYQFSTTGEHIVQYSIENYFKKIPNNFLNIVNKVIKVIIGDYFEKIGSNAFNGCSGLTSCTIGNSVTSIDGSAFHNCSGLTSIEIPSGVTSLGDGVFQGCSGLTSIEIPSGVTSIGSGVFQGCSSLTSINIPSGVTSIGNNAFRNCTGLTSIEIPDSVTTIDGYAFSDCSGLTSIVFNATTAPTLDATVFNGVSTNGVLTVPSGSQGYCNWIGGVLPSGWTIEGVTCGSGSGSGA